MTAMSMGSAWFTVGGLPSEKCTPTYLDDLPAGTAATMLAPGSASLGPAGLLLAAAGLDSGGGSPQPASHRPADNAAKHEARPQDLIIRHPPPGPYSTAPIWQGWADRPLRPFVLANLRCASPRSGRPRTTEMPAEMPDRASATRSMPHGAGCAASAGSRPGSARQSRTRQTTRSLP